MAAARGTRKHLYEAKTLAESGFIRVKTVVRNQHQSCFGGAGRSLYRRPYEAYGTINLTKCLKADRGIIEVMRRVDKCHRIKVHVIDLITFQDLADNIANILIVDSGARR